MKAVTTITAALLIMLSSGPVAAQDFCVSQFVSYPGNLHLTSGSMCIGAGTSVGAPGADWDGDVRDASAPDIGADEFTP